MKANLKATSFAILTIAFLTGCSGSPTRDSSFQADTRTTATQPSTTSARPIPSAGRQSISRISGDYRGYEALDEFIARMQNKHRFSREYLIELFSNAQRKQWTLDYLSREAGPAAPRPGAWSRYRAQFLTEPHIAGGVAFWRQHAASLRRASERYGIPAEYIIGIMGVETIYGRNTGKHRVLDALTTLAFDYPRRATYFTEELENFLVMTNEERIDPTEPLGSYAGAMGLGQFMPSSFLKWAVDFDEDGRRNLWEADDAIGSIANYFVQHGWQRGEAVVTPAVAMNASAQNLESGYDSQYSLAELRRQGIHPVGPIAEKEVLRLLRLSANSGEEYWLGHQNFYVITRYNHSTHYAMAVHQLAQAIKARVGL